MKQTYSSPIVKSYFLVFLTLICQLANAQAPFFEKKDLMKVGVYYYPEQWDKSQWDRDLKKMKEMGFEFTHFAEFAWSQLEPEEGKYTFEWLDEAIATADKYGIKVIMCTPTPTPPAWLTTKYPEVLVVKETDQQVQHGGRTHYSWSSRKYRELTEKIATQLALRYGKDKRVMGWQIDNEPGHYGVDDFGPEVQARFRLWLKNKYKTVQALNKAWGNDFWSENYNDFSQVLIPNLTKQIGGINPHGYVDYRQFMADECADYFRLQATILKKNVAPFQWVTTNFMHEHEVVDPWRNDADLDFLTYTLYPVGGGYTNAGGFGEEDFRIGLPSRVSFANDLHRYKKGFTGVMELQPGQVNWGSYNPQVYPGVIRAWLWNAFVGGCSFACSYRFRQPLYNSEQYHHGMLGTDGVTPSVGGKEYAQFMAEMKQLKLKYNSANTMPVEHANRKTAILWNLDNVWDTQIGAQTFQWKPMSVILKLHGSLKSLGCAVDFISEDFDFKKYKTLVLPFYIRMDKALVAKLKDYVNNGGNLIFTARSGMKDRNGHLQELPYGALIQELTGAENLFYDCLPKEKKGLVRLGTTSFEWNNWGDVFQVQPGTEAIATYESQYYAGKTAATYRKLGKGSVAYMGIDSDDGKFEKEAFKAFYARSGIKTLDLPDGMIVDWRDGFWVAINYHSSKTINLPFLPKGKFVFGSPQLKPADVAVWEE